jgi:phosphotransferase system HPr (HPr) family protein
LAARFRETTMILLRTAAFMNQNAVGRQSVTVNLENGLHLVPCSIIARTARRFECDVHIIKGEVTVDAKNVLDLMTLNAAKGTILILEACGTGAPDVTAELVRLFESGFDGADQPQPEE